MEKLRVYNTLSRKKEVFEPLNPGRVGMYVCGVTVYSYSHLGHGRCYVAFDAIFRYLKYLGYRVTYIQNITDLDDKLIKQANEEGGEGDIKSRITRIADKYTVAYFEDMEKLNVLSADDYPKATGNIAGMQKIVRGLIDKGYAYQRRGNVYFEVAKFGGYGDLSGKNLEELKAGARVKIDEEKKSPLDFALWKESAPLEPSWESPWGKGRPGWHIECSAMSMKELGPTFDIHGGGQDLIFPHHENERAQSEAYSGRPFARYWLHNGFVTIDREKMSKSLGNVFNLRDIFQVYEPRVVRFFLLSQHYRSPVDYSDSALDQARRGLFRLDNCYGLGLDQAGDVSSAEPDEETISRFEEAMNDDFNTAAALAVAYDVANEFFQGGKVKRLKNKLNAMVKICATLGIGLKNLIHAPKRIELSEHADIIDELLGKNKLSEEEIHALARARQALRNKKQWTRADTIRANLEERGIMIRDLPDGTPTLVYYPEDPPQRQ